MTLPRCTHAPQGAAAVAAARLRAALPRLRTDRLDLRAPETRDFPAWARIMASPDSRYMGGPVPAEEAWSDFCGYVAGWLLHGHGLWAVERRADATLLGFVHLGLEWDDFDPELGWLFLPEARGQGYATEAARAARDHAITLVGPGTAVSYIDPENATSIAVAERIGGHPDPDAPRGDAADLVYRHGVRP